MIHVNGFSFVCVRLCLARFDFSENYLLHMAHVNGFSFECVRLWLTRLDFSENDFLHMAHVVYDYGSQDLIFQKMTSYIWHM